jgi:hypothetical protein
MAGTELLFEASQWLLEISAHVRLGLEGESDLDGKRLSTLSVTSGQGTQGRYRTQSRQQWAVGAKEDALRFERSR